MKYSNIKNVKGFTLIELMMVVAIIGILLAIAIPNYNSYFLRACENVAMGDLSNMAAKLEIYKQGNFSYNGATAAGVYSDTSPLGASGTDVAYSLEVLVLNGGRDYGLIARVNSLGECKGNENDLFYNPVGQNCKLANGSAYSATCAGGDTWD